MVKKGRKGVNSRSRQKTSRRKVKAGKVFVYALALAALTGGSYLAYDTIKRKRRNNQNSLPPDIIINNNLPSGERLSLPAAKTSASRNTSTNSLAVNRQTSSTSLQVVFNPADIAARLYRAAQQKSINEVLTILKEIKSVQDYSSVNDYYKKQSFISRTIVTDLLDYAFKSSEANKRLIRDEFLRIGLKVNSSGIWSLQGLRLYKDLITLRDSVVIDSKNNRIPVKKNTILGDEMEIANGMTWFRSIDNTILKVPTRDVKYT